MGLNETASILISAATRVTEDVDGLKYTVYATDQDTYYVGGQTVDGLVVCPPGQTYVDVICGKKLGQVVNTNINIKAILLSNRKMGIIIRILILI